MQADSTYEPSREEKASPAHRRINLLVRLPGLLARPHV